MTIKKTFIALFFLLQMVAIGYQLYGETNFFNWSMYHTCIIYKATVTIDGTELSEDQFLERYKFSNSGFEGRALAHLKRKFVKREALINDPKKVVIELHYTENSHKDVWHWNN
ncbi:MAG: hypothetical protein HRU26_12955 [Psychroserpens sp.]|nr:hypothetical protein [Psychroserpens sp.]